MIRLLDSLSKLATLLEAVLGKEELIARLVKLGYVDTATVYHNIQNLDPTPTKKYMAWVLFMMEKKEIGVDTDGERNRLSLILRSFVKALPKLEQKDLYQYASPQEVEQAIDAARAENAAEKAGKLGEGVELVGANGGYEVYHITTVDACVKASSGTKWCTSDRDTSSNYIDTHNVGMYLVFKGSKKHAMLTITSMGGAAYDLKDKDYVISDLALLQALDFMSDNDKASLTAFGAVDRSIAPASWFTDVPKFVPYVYRYAKDVLLAQMHQVGFPPGEPTLMDSPEYAFKYARYVLGKPFPMGELAIARGKEEDAFYYAFHLLNLPDDEAKRWGKEYRK